MTSISITRRDTDKHWSVATGAVHQFQVAPFEGRILELEDAHFHHDSAVLLPDHGTAPDAARVTGLGVLAVACRFAAANPADRLLIAGHTDTTGQAGYNVDLSTRRANSALHVLLGERDAWVDLSISKFKVEDVQQILKWAAWTFGFDCDPGAIDNIAGPRTTAALSAFQAGFNAKFKQNIARSGTIDPPTWGAFFDCYIDVLKTLLPADDAGLATRRKALAFVASRATVGCGENFPIEQPRRNDYRSEINRRVEFLFFAPGQEPRLPCHTGSACNPGSCEIYDPRWYRHVHIPLIPLPPIPAGSYDVVNVKAPKRIAPGAERIAIEYEVQLAGGSISSGAVEIVRQADAKVLAAFPLQAAELTAGAHAFTWDGHVDSGAEFPDAFATIEHSPYQARVTVSGFAGTKAAAVVVKVELKNFTVELGARDILANAQDRAVYDQVGALPATDIVKLKLPSNVFTIDGSVDEKTSQSSFLEYQSLWSGGPRVPLIATATVLDSSGKEVRAGKAMGRAMVLWDFADAAQSRASYLATALGPPPATSKSAGAKPFVDKALAYDAGATRPKGGDNCHLDRGGKRTSASGPPLFHGADGGTSAFPFAVDKGKTRFWGCFSTFERSGAQAGQSGAIFRPSRTAGDNYRVTAYLDLAASLDTADDKPAGAAREVAIGSFEIWRLVELAEHFKKGPQTTGTMPTVAEYYADAYVEIHDSRGAVKDFTREDYDASFPPAFAAAQGRSLLKKYALAPGSQWDAPVPGVAGATPAPTPWIATFRPYAAFQAAVATGEHLGTADVVVLLTTNKLGDAASYADALQVLAINVAEQLLRPRATRPGITVVQFGGTSNLEAQSTFPLNGLAVSKTSNADRGKAAFLLCQTNAQAAQTPAHEIGHLMFLPHSPRVDRTDGSTISTGGGITADFHDGANLNCLMSYARPRPGFCGLCLLRLRGWKGDEFDRNGPKVVK